MTKAGFDAIPDEQLRQLESAISAALDSDDHSNLNILGYGEVSVAVGWPTSEPRWAVKRMPPFPDEPSFDAYSRLVLDYIDTLRGHGAEILDTELRSLPSPDGRCIGYLVQPVLEPATLGPSVLRAASPADGHPLIESIVDTVMACTDGRTGIDAQITNWAWIEGRAVNLDVNTPFVFDEAGHPVLDINMFIGALPWVVRATQRKAGPKIIARWAKPHWTLTDLAMNLHKDRLEEWIPVVVAAANARLDRPIDEGSLKTQYKKEAKLWVKLHRLKRIDRWWQRNVRRRRYEFLVADTTDYA